MKKRLKNGLFMLVVLLCLAGCGMENNDPATAEQEVADIQNVTTGTESLYINDWILLQSENPEMEYQKKTLFYDTCGSKLYMLWAYFGKEDTMERLALYVFDGDTMVGFPTREGSKNYIMADNAYLVVNAKAEHLEEIKELIAYLLSYENQFNNSYMSVREDVIRDSVEYVDYENKYMLKVSANGDTHMTLAAKPDGNSWLEDYLAFIDTCEPEPRWHYTLVGVIISEEVQPYFAGDKSAEEVAKIIQSRVQLYLDESR